MHAAATSPHPEMVKALLRLGLGAGPRSALGVTPLMLACESGETAGAEILLAWGAIPEDEDYLGRSVRDYAVAAGNEATLKLVDSALSPWTPGQDGAAPHP